MKQFRPRIKSGVTNLNIMKKIVFFLFFFLLSNAASALVLKVGESAPDFSAPTTSGQTKLSDFSGKWLVIYFYPKAFTSGCTEQSCSLRDGYKSIQKTGAVILGVSLDNLEKQKEFKSKYQLPFELISDTTKEISKKYGSLGFMGLYSERKTFIINPNGKIAYIFESVDTAKHDVEILKQLQKLQIPESQAQTSKF